MPPDSSDFLDSDFDDEKIRSALVTSKAEDVTTDTIQELKYKCPVEGCEMAFKRMTQLDRHEYNHTGIKRHMCIVEDCDKKYITIQHLKRHVARFHEKKFPEKVFSCSEESCKLKFRSLWDMEKHFKSAHENLKPHVCSECQESFRRKMQLRRHMIKHTGEYPFKCNICKRGFLYEKAMEQHKCSTYICIECEIEFSKWSELRAHQKENNCKWPSCKVCSKKFKRRDNLTQHMISHQSDEERVVYPCTYEGCEKFYFYPRNLDAHIKSCHEKVTFKCTYPDCDKEYAWKLALRRHIQKCHESKQVKSTKSEKVPKKRARRKDFGKKKISTASALSGITVDRTVDEMLINGEGNQIEMSEIEIIIPHVEASIEMN